ncbi:hypothetical protein JR316_0009227 [Psilocybe cubensis]|uniref:Uncharacterized protein n=1 Tax=Psilocybe cubensis TaxID=181762 RepID=A0ACB8GU72_PSICU|nr:hypothetical protein JR316_0009227 [Psilocybe cubensis]KAH9478766.1 hypothetical protein JR316_0009227 [Psilocybe cubensis]
MFWCSVVFSVLVLLSFSFFHCIIVIVTPLFLLQSPVIMLFFIYVFIAFCVAFNFSIYSATRGEGVILISESDDFGQQPGNRQTMSRPV